MKPSTVRITKEQLLAMMDNARNNDIVLDITQQDGSEVSVRPNGDEGREFAVNRSGLIQENDQPWHYASNRDIS